MVSEIDAVALRRLDRDGQRYTQKRRQLVRLLAEAAQPLTIPDILRLDSSLAQSSTYRNLVVLERSGVVQRIVATDEWVRYELAEDLTEHHHHLICQSCGAVRDFTVSSRLERTLDEALVKVAAEHGFELERHRLDLIGRCAVCT